MRKMLGLFAVALVVLVSVADTSPAQTTTIPKTLTQTQGAAGGSSTWMSNLTLPTFRFENLFTPFQSFGTQGQSTTTIINPANSNEYLQQFGFTRPVRRY